MSQPNRLNLGALLTMLAMFGFASMDAMSKFLVRSYPIAQTLWIRYGIFTLFALAVARMARLGSRGGGAGASVLHAYRSRRPALQFGRALLGLVENALFVLALFYLPLADTHAVVATSPLLVIALAAPILSEHAGMKRWLAVATGFAGVLLIIRPGFQKLEWPLLVPLLGAFLWALYQILTRLTARHDRPETTLLWTASVSFAVLSFIGPWQWHKPDAFAWVLIVGVALLGSLSHYALIRALDFAPAGSVQRYSYSMLVWAALLGWLVFGDLPDAFTIAGAGVVVGSGIYTWQLDRHKQNVIK